MGHFPATYMPGRGAVKLGWTLRFNYRFESSLFSSWGQLVRSDLTWGPDDVVMVPRQPIFILFLSSSFAHD